MNEHTYTLRLTERQARLLSYACDQYCRLICGQNWAYQELLESAWEKRCKKATGDMMDKEWDGGWFAMREEAERVCKDIKKRYWGLESNAMYGIHYDPVADILHDLHQVIRHQFWLDGDRKYNSVDSYTPMQVGDEPLAKMEREGGEQ